MVCPCITITAILPRLVNLIIRVEYHNYRVRELQWQKDPQQRQQKKD